MGNLAVAEELAGSEELDELYKLDASDAEPDDEDEDEDDDGGDDDDIKPDEIPQG